MLCWVCYVDAYMGGRVMAHTFKAGDRVRCVADDTCGGRLVKGTIYEVASVGALRTGTPVVGLKGIGTESPSFYPRRFESVLDGPPTITDSHGVERRVVALSDILRVFDEQLVGWADARQGPETLDVIETVLRHAETSIRNLFGHEVDDDEN